MNTDYHKRATEILKSISYATLSTVTPEGDPWNSPVKHEIDEELNIYWASDQKNQHSINVSNNGKVYIVIYDSTVPEGDGEGVYLKAKVVIVDDPEEIAKVRKIKKGEDYEIDPSELLGEDNRRMYKAIPSQVWINDAEVKDGVFIRDYKIELDISKLKEELDETA